MKRITQYWIGITLVVLLALAAAAYAQGGFTLSRSTVDNGGGTLNSGGFTLTGAIGQPEAGFALSSGSFTLVGGAFAGGAAALAPEIDVQFYGQSFPNGYDYIDFESVVIGGQMTHTFTISNTGNADLNLTGTPAVTLTTGAHFTVTAQPASLVISNTATTFQITFAPSAAGSFTDTVNIANNDADENPFTFVIAGTGTVPTAEADLAISQSLSHDFLNTIFTIVAQNDGPDDAPGAVISATFPAEITSITWTCASSGGATCTASGSGNTIYDTLGSFPNSGVVTYTVRTRVLGDSVYTNAAEVMPPAGVTDPDLSNNYSEQTTRYLLLLPLILKDASLTPAP